MTSMKQVTLRLDEGLARDIKRAALESGRSVNSYVDFALRALLDPELAGDEVASMRERFRRAGLLAEPLRPSGPPPTPEELEAARRAAATGKPLSDYISEGRD